MPPQTRTRATKLQKENIHVGKKFTEQKVKGQQNVAQSIRKPLADKTNSLSDTDSTLPPIIAASKVKENSHKSVKVLPKKKLLKAAEEKSRPKRNCRPKSAKDKSTSSDMNGSNSFKTPSKDFESSLIGLRPKRICRLPSKFEDHFISPSKLIPLQPCHASTPIVEKKMTIKSVESVNKNIKPPVSKQKKSFPISSKKKVKTPDRNTVKVAKETNTKIKEKENTSTNSLNKSSPDSNNNGRYKARPKRNVTKLQSKQINGHGNKITPFARRLLNNSMSFRVLEDNKKPKNRDVYEFTFDPDDEPTPQKKKRKRTIKKKPKPKAVFVKSTYDSNVAKALTDLKSKIKLSQPQVQSNTKTTDNVQSTQNIAKPIVSNEKIPPNNSMLKIPSVNESNMKGSLHISNYASIRVEDIAADFEPIENNDINYSPVNSPLRSKSPEISNFYNKDPLNLQGDMSIFNDQPVASSSMNVSARHPLASPWRVEFGCLPIKWQANTYVKPNMTPAVESSFINAEDLSKKKHVYTNLLPDIEPQAEDPPVLTQPSIISFMRQAAERSLNRKRKRLASPTKKSYIFDDVVNTSDTDHKTSKKAKLSKDSISDKSGEKSSENSLNSNNESPTKVQKHKDCTYFGFNDSENVDQENVSPVKNKTKRSVRSLKTRAVLKDLNAQKGPTRAVMAVAKSKLPSSEVVQQLYDQLKSAEDAPIFPVKETNGELEIGTNIEAPLASENNEDAESFHLFEDLELIHHLKPQRKSYSKPKRVAFQRNSSDSDNHDHNGSAVLNMDFEEDTEDPSFHLPNVKERKTVTKKRNQKKKQLLKKEEKEVEEWAAGFNSMCEDIEEFPLVVE